MNEIKKIGKLHTMKTRKDFTKEQLDVIVDYCQPQYCSWIGEWMQKNNENEINEYNVFDYIYDEIGDPEYFIEDILENLD